MRLRRLWHKPLAERQLDSELKFHLEQQIVHYVASGMPAEEARRQASIEFGGLERFKEECRETRWEYHLDVLVRDFRVYSVVAYSTARRMHEIGLRMALGAAAGDVLKMVLWQGLRFLAAGIAVGLAVTFALSRIISRPAFGGACARSADIGGGCHLVTGYRHARLLDAGTSRHAHQSPGRAALRINLG